MSPSSARSSKRGAVLRASDSGSGSGSRRSLTRQTSTTSRGKRKLDTEGGTDSDSAHPTAVRPGKSSCDHHGSHSKSGNTKRSGTGQSIAELWSTIDSDSSEGPRPAKRRSLHRAFETKKSPHTSPPSTNCPLSTVPKSFAEMYTFKTKQAATQQNGLVDLTKSSPTRNGMYNGINKSLANPHLGPRKMVVKSLRPLSASRDDKSALLEQKWSTLDAALEQLFTKPDSKLLLEELYSSSEFLCRQGLSKELNSRMKAKCTDHLDNRLRRRLNAESTSVSSVEALQLFGNTWNLWQDQLKSIRHVFFYLNQTHLVRSTEDPVLEVLGLQLFRSLVFNDPAIKQHVLKGVVEIIDRKRRATSNDHETKLAKQAISTLHDLGVYTTDLEPLLASTSEEFFASWKTSEAETSDLPHYVRSCTTLLEHEMERCDILGMDRSTKDLLSDRFDEIMIGGNITRLTEEEALLDMFEANLTHELEQTYTLLKRKDQQQLLSSSFAKFVEADGSSIVFDEKRETEMVVRLLEFKKKLDYISKHSFHKNETLDNTLHKSFEIFMNKTKKSQSTWDTDNAKPGEMIAKHVDLLLKGGPKAIPGLRKDDKNTEEQDFDDEGNDDKEVEQHLDDALDLFRFVHGKAVFEAFYKKDLARRLLMGRTQSFDAERSMLTRLRNECGAGFTHNLESMFKDMDLAREEMKSYNQLLSDRGNKPSLDLSVNVLSVAAWPTYPDVAVNLPQAVSQAQANFEKHYKEKHVGRRLHWKATLSHCQLKSNFPKGKKEIVVSGFQAVVLLLFNEVPSGESLSYEQIKTATALPDHELIRTLQSLACAKYRVLTKSPRGREITPSTDTFSFNTGFTDPKYRVKINQIQLKETKEENKETHQRVAADRHYETQAAIVRIMKSRKVIGHNELIVEVIKATRSRGVLDQGDIKRNIEKLIEKEYMERDDEVKNGYRYLA